MNKISHHFKLAPERADQLTRISNFYTKAQHEDTFLPPRKINKTDIIEWLIDKEFKSLVEQGFEL